MSDQWKIPPDDETGSFALREYEKLMGNQRHQTQTWRTVAVISQLTNVIGLIMLVWAFNLPKSEPLFISVNDIGETRYIGGVKAQSSNVTDIMVEAQVRTFLTYVETIPQDAEVLKQNLTDCYSMLTNNGATKLSDRLKANNPFDVFGLESRSVQIESVLSLTNDSYQIDYFVKISGADGHLNKTLHRRALMTVTLLEPAENDILVNPAGIYIKSFDITNLEE